MLYVLVGNIASGKSTYVNETINKNTIVVCNDTITNAVHGNNYKMYNRDLKPLYKMLETNMIYYGLSHDMTVIVDATNQKRSTRARYIQLAKSAEKNVVAICFAQEQPEIHARRRANSDNRGYTYEEWLEVATRMHKQFEPVLDNEGFSEILHR